MENGCAYAEYTWQTICLSIRQPILFTLLHLMLGLKTYR